MSPLPSLPPLDPELAALLDVERRRADPSSAVRSEVSANIHRILGDVVAIPHAVPAPEARRPRTTWVKRAGPALLMGLVVGGLVGSRLQARVDAEASHEIAPPAAATPSTVPETRPSSESPVVPVQALPPPEPSAAAHAPVTSVPGARTIAAKGPATDEQLAAERALVDTARSAIARGDPRAALDAVRKHEQRFPHGQLTEEREVLAVQALVADGRVQEAAERGARFRLQHPGSVLLPVIDAALQR